MIKIGKIEISDNSSPFIIAEMSGNHNQSLQRALEIVEAAAKAGAHAIKLQTYTADTMTVKGAYTIADENSLWNGRELYDLYQEAYTPWEWHKPIFDKAKELGILAFSSPFDETAVDFLEKFNVPFYNISTFASTLADVSQAVNVLRQCGVKDLILLKCTSTYPSTPENTNILTIPHMAQMFDCHVGLSDHTMGIGVAVASVALGARVIEKHFTLNRADGGVDSAFSLEPAELAALVTETQRAALSLGKVKYGIQKAEEKSLFFKRSLYIVYDIKAGEILTKDNVRVIRPGLGLAPKYYEEILGKKANQDIPANTPLAWGHFN
jgi:sialic acid synthase SpsE